MKTKGLTIFIVLSLLFVSQSFAQFSIQEQKQIDSLNSIIKNKNSHDTTLAAAYNSLSELLASSNLDTVIFLSTKAQQIAEKDLAAHPNFQIAKSLRISLAAALNNIGYVHMNKVNNQLAIEYYNKSLKVEEENGNIQGLASAYNNIGLIYHNLGDIPKALEYYHKSLKIKEQFGDKKGMAYSYNNIGYVHGDQCDFPLALEYYLKSLKIREEIGDKKGMAMSYNNIGIIHYKRGDIPMALDYYQKSLKIKQEIGDKKGIANSYHNIGAIYKKQGNPTLALEYYQKGLKIREEIGDKEGMANSNYDLGDLKLEQGEIAHARGYAEKGLKLAKEIGFPGLIEANAKLLSKIAIKQNKWQEALEMRNLEIQMKDSLASEGAIKAIAQQQAKYEYEKAKAITDVEQAKKDAISREEKQKQSIIIYAIAAGLGVVLLFLFILLKRFKVTQKQKNIIQKQKHLVDEKQKEILDSINYAERIQRSFLATTEILDKNLKDYFVYFQPKDIVSGDFYWAAQLSNGNFALATADSTGHGVPGAIMSILNISSLEKSLEEEKLTEPSEILNHTRLKIIERLKKDGSSEGGKDGMDCSLISFDFEKGKLSYAAANNPVWIVREKQLLEFAPDKMPVGKHDNDQIPFTQQTIELKKGDVVYALTDGMPDQFGGSKGKKFKYKQLKELLILISAEPMETQKQKLSDALNNWKGNLEQVDDITLIGIRV
ncbi:MAG: hypothetical protein A3F72_14060 [Bacteroidetes bacterium RIFCSPLOWO2_12_FULL_35_15]|nr:MAG: hypothetical protein A3F72_14060 [Bacteroidetes bacterium RIFCSPLOWO2_12_FULL_35_15]